MFLIFAKKYWSYILNVLLVVLIVLMYKHFSTNESDTRLQYLKQSEESQLKFSQELISLLSKNEADNSKFVQEVQRVGRETEEALKSEMDIYNQRIEILNSEELKAFEEIKTSKTARITSLTKSITKNPDSRAEDIYKRFGIEVYKKDIPK